MGDTADLPADGWWRSFVTELPARTGKLAVTRLDGRPHIAPVWVDLEPEHGSDGGGVQIVFMTSAETIKGRSILRDGRVAICFDDERPPFSFVTISGTATTSTDPAPLLEWATRIGGRYMGAERAAEYGRRNAVPPEMLVRVTIDSVIAVRDISD